MMALTVSEVIKYTIKMVISYYSPREVNHANQEEHNLALVDPLCSVNQQQLTESLHFYTSTAKPQAQPLPGYTSCT